MNYFDDYYIQEEPQKEPGSYIPQGPETPKPVKKRRGMPRWISVLLVIALVLGSCGATAFAMELRWQKKMDLANQRMEDKLNAMKAEAKVPAADITLTATPGEAMTPGQVYQQNVNAVVAVVAEISSRDSSGRPMAGYSGGTGFIISSDGYMVTNYHVIEDSVSVKVSTYDGTEYAASVVGYEENNDLALLKLEGEDFPHVTIGSSSALQIGDQVVAIGNALSTFQFSLTAGYVSGVDRVVDTEGVAMNMIQTDVAINSGNSGGPLFNMKGEVVGITTAKFSGTSRSGVTIEGISFAIPMDDVTGMIEDLRNYGYVTGAYLGVMVRDVETTVQSYGLPAGAFVESVTEGSAAEKGGIHAQDIITEVGGYEVTSVSDLTRVLRKFSANETVTVRVYRLGQLMNLSVTLDEKPRETEPAQSKTQPESQKVPEDFADFYEFFKEFMGVN